MSADFRLLDVESMQDDMYQAEEQTSVDEVMARVAAKEDEVNSMLSRGDHASALAAAMDSPPTDTTDAEVRNRFGAMVARILGGVRDSEIETAVNSFSPEEQDLLTKFVYRGMALCIESGKLLKWHAALVKAAGHGTVVRALSDRATV